MKTFDDWFHELENHCLRSERFYDELGMYRNDLERLSKTMRKWLWAAYDMGREHEREQNGSVRKTTTEVPEEL